VGTGFTDQILVELAQHLQPLARSSSPFGAGEVPRETQFVEPRLVCEVEFTEWTSRTGQLRHPSFKGLRWDKAAIEVVREEVYFQGAVLDPLEIMDRLESEFACPVVASNPAMLWFILNKVERTYTSTAAVASCGSGLPPSPELPRCSSGVSLA